MAQARRELADGDLAQASEKGWGAAAQMLKAVAQQRGWDHSRHRHHLVTASRLRSETGDGDIRRLFNTASALHENFYEEALADRETMRPAFARLLDRARPPAGCGITPAAMHQENGQTIIIDDNCQEEPDEDEADAQERVVDAVARLKSVAQNSNNQKGSIAVSQVRISLTGAALAVAALFGANILRDINPLSAKGTALANATAAGVAALAFNIGRTIAPAKLTMHTAKKITKHQFEINKPTVLATASDNKRTFGILDAKHAPGHFTSTAVTKDWRTGGLADWQITGLLNQKIYHAMKR